MKTVTWFRFVRHADVAAFELAGWFVCGDLGSTHGRWAVLMQWAGKGQPRT